MRRLWFVTALAVLGLSACTKNNPNFCSDAGALQNCRAADAAHDTPAHEVPETVDAVDASDAAEVSDAGDAAEVADAADAIEAGPEAICRMDDQCLALDAGTPACDTSDGGARCVECLANMHCKGAKPVCNTATETCVECLGNGAENECPDSSKSACNKTSHTCVACVDNTKCGGTTPVCETSTNTCRPCKADSECKGIGAEICVDWDGHCATSAEVVTFDRGGATCDGTGGKYCTAASALTALTGQKDVLVVTGTMAIPALVITGSIPSPLLVVGRSAPVVAAGAGDNAGIAMDGTRKVYVRDLKVTGSTAGVLASAGAELHLTRATIVGNAAGGVLTKNASFDITNTIIANNSAGDATGGILWAGARLGDVPTGGLSHFENNTVVGNQSTGVSCAATYAILGSIVHGNMTAQISGCATTQPCCGATDPDPALDANFRLMSTSPCIDKLDPTATSPTVDIDGQPRPSPAGGKNDCGADELQK
jgi:hypothetical protein